MEAIKFFSHKNGNILIQAWSNNCRKYKTTEYKFYNQQR